MPESEFIVARAALGAPDGFLGDVEGKWYRRPDYPTGRFERRADGVLAEVFEARP